jgi:hypothetical protein
MSEVDITQRKHHIFSLPALWQEMDQKASLIMGL